MSIRLFILTLLFLTFSIQLNAQDTFNYTVIENDAEKGHDFYCGLSFFPIAFELTPNDGELIPFDTDGRLGIVFNSFNIYDRFTLDFYSYFTTGISIYNNIDDGTPPHQELDNKMIYNNSNITITTELFSFNKTKEKSLGLGNYSQGSFASFVDHNIKNMFGFRFGYGFSNLPLRRWERIEVYNDSVFTYVYGLTQHSLHFGLSYSNLANLRLMTDLFGEIENKPIRNFYFDVICLLGSKNKYFEKVNEKVDLTDYEPESIDKGLSYRIGYERYYNFPKGRIPISTKLGFELINQELFNINNIRRNSIFFQIKITAMYSK
ncbi:MAG: hypothetical protein ACOCXO_00010 [Bacteroidota bacterium]